MVGLDLQAGAAKAGPERQTEALQRRHREQWALGPVSRGWCAEGGVLGRLIK